MITRQQLDESWNNFITPPVYLSSDDQGLVEVFGALQAYTLWVNKDDRSLLPCLTGEEGGMPGSWENWITAWHISNLIKYDTYVDVGANYGYYSVLALKYGLKVIAIEPNPLVCFALKQTRFDQVNKEFFTIIQAAASDKKKKVDLITYDSLHGSTQVKESEHGIVSAVTLDSLKDLMDKKVLIKMDVEGSELDAWRGSSEIRKVVKPDFIIEYTPKHYGSELYDEMKVYGDVYEIDFNGHEVAVDESKFSKDEKDWFTLLVRAR